MNKKDYLIIFLCLITSILVLVMIIQLNMIKLNNLELNRFVLENCNVSKQEIVTTYKRP